MCPSGRRPPILFFVFPLVLCNLILKVLVGHRHLEQQIVKETLLISASYGYTNWDAFFRRYISLSRYKESFPSTSFQLNHQKRKLIGAKSWMDGNWDRISPTCCEVHFFTVLHIQRRVQERMYNNVSDNGSIPVEAVTEPRFILRWNRTGCISLR